MSEVSPGPIMNKDAILPNTSEKSVVLYGSSPSPTATPENTPMLNIVAQLEVRASEQSVGKAEESPNPVQPTPLEPERKDSIEKPEETIIEGITAAVSDTAKSLENSEAKNDDSGRKNDTPPKEEPPPIDERTDRMNHAREVIEKYKPLYDQMTDRNNPKHILDVVGIDGTETRERDFTVKWARFQADLNQSAGNFSSLADKISRGRDLSPEDLAEKALYDQIHTFHVEFKTRFESYDQKAWVESRNIARNKLQDMSEIFSRTGIEDILETLTFKQLTRKEGCSSVREDRDTIKSIVRKFYENVDDVTDEYKAQVLNEIKNPEIRNAVSSGWNKTLEECRQYESKVIGVFNSNLAAVQKKGPTAFMNYLENYANGKDEQGRPITTRVIKAESQARAILHKIQDFEAAIDHADYENLKNVITGESLSQKIQTDFKNKPYAQTIEGFIKDYRTRVFDGVVVGKVAESLQGVENIDGLLELMSPYASESGSIKRIAGELRTAQNSFSTEARTELFHRKLSDLDKPLDTSSKINSPKNISSQKLQETADKLFQTWKSEQIQAIRYEIDAMKTQLRAQMEDHRDITIDEWFSEAGAVRIRYGDNWEKAREAHLKMINKNIDTFLNSPAITGLSVNQLQKRLAGEGLSIQINTVTHKSRQIPIHFESTVASSIESFAHRDMTKKPPDLIVSLPQNNDPRPEKRWTTEQRTERWSQTISAVMLERLRLEKPNQTVDTRDKKIAQLLGVQFPNYIQQPETNQPDFDLAITKAKEHLKNVGFSDNEVDRVSQNLIAQSHQEAILNVADKYLCDAEGNFDFSKLTDVATVDRYYFFTEVPELMDSVRDEWTEKVPNKRAELLDTWIANTTRYIPLKGLEEQLRRVGNFENSSLGNNNLVIESALSEILPEGQEERLRQAIQQSKSPKEFQETIAEVLKTSDKLKTRVQEINTFALSFLQENIRNPQRIQELGIDTKNINDRGWLNIVLNATRGRFGKTRDPKFRVKVITRLDYSGRQELEGVSRQKLESVYDYGQSLQKAIAA